MIEEPWRLEIDHTTLFRYDAPVRSSYNEARMVPLTTLRQTTMSSQVTTRPAARQFRYWDYWGTQVLAFDVPEPHDELRIEAHSVVDTGYPSRPAPLSWAELAVRVEPLCELLTQTRYTPADRRLEDVGAGLRASDPFETVQAVVEWVHGALAYETGVTGVHTSAVEALDAGRGVCQDFAHLAVSLLRELGIPARYVSGYLHPTPDPDTEVEVTGQSHAWAEAWVGDWWEVDPTNLVAVGPRHVTVGRGRDYADVTPIKGVYAGETEDSMTTTVVIKRSR